MAELKHCFLPVVDYCRNGIFQSATKAKGTMKGRGKIGKMEEKSERERRKGKEKGEKVGEKGGKGEKKRENGRNIAKWWGRFSSILILMGNVESTNTWHLINGVGLRFKNIYGFVTLRLLLKDSSVGCEV